MEVPHQQWTAFIELIKIYFVPVPMPVIILCFEFVMFIVMIKHGIEETREIMLKNSVL